MTDPKPAPAEPRCELCGEPMPEDETMFKFHGYSGPCPNPPLPAPRDWMAEWKAVPQETRNWIINTLLHPTATRAEDRVSGADRRVKAARLAINVLAGWDGYSLALEDDALGPGGEDLGPASAASEGEPWEKEEVMSEDPASATRKQVRIMIDTRESNETHGVRLEAYADVFGYNTPEEAVSIVRIALGDSNLRVEYVDPEKEG